ncbi:MAG: peroxiredoxin [Asticcacaulis sp.]
MSDPLVLNHPAPTFDLPCLAPDGTHLQISLDTLKGQAFVLFFYPKDDTSGCTKEAIGFSEVRDQFDSVGVQVIGVSNDTLASHEKFSKKHNLTVHLASAYETDMISRYGAWVEKSMYGKKYMGIERSTVLIDAEGRVQGLWRKVKVPGHVQTVLDAALALTKS